MTSSIYFETSNLSLCPYLELNGLKYVKADLVKDPKSNRIQVKVVFLDPEQRGTELEFEFRHSNEKKYKDCLFHYRKIINDLLGQ